MKIIKQHEQNLKDFNLYTLIYPSPQIPLFCTKTGFYKQFLVRGHLKVFKEYNISYPKTYSNVIECLIKMQCDFSIFYFPKYEAQGTITWITGFFLKYINIRDTDTIKEWKAYKRGSRGDRERGRREGGRTKRRERKKENCYLSKVQCLHFGQIFKVQGSCCIMLTFENYANAIFFLDYISFSFS